MKKIYKFLLIVFGCALLGQGLAYADGGSDDTSGIMMFKKSEYTGSDDMYKITLETFVTGTSQRTKISKPVDIVLSMDVSTSMYDKGRLSTYQQLFTGDQIEYLHSNGWNTGSNKNPNYRYKVQLGGTGNQYNMQYSNNKWQYYINNKWTDYNRTADQYAQDKIYTNIKLDLLENACRAFIDVLTESAATGIDHNLGYNTWNGSLVTSQEGAIASVATTGATYRSALSNLSNASGTNPAAGLTEAKAQLDKFYNDMEGTEGFDPTKRSKIVVLFTDGEPSSGNKFGPIFHAAHELKANGVTVYAVGIFDSETSNAGRLNGDEKTDGTNLQIKEYMQIISSDYPNANWKTNSTTTNQNYTTGNKVASPEYYRLSDGANLTEIFTDIATEAGSDAYELTNTSSSVIDVMATDFELPEGFTAASVTTKQWVCDSQIDGSQDRDIKDEAGNIIAKIRNGYHFVPYTDETQQYTEARPAGNDKIYDGDIPVITFTKESATEKESVKVTNFYFSLDDDLVKDSAGNIYIDPSTDKPVIDKYYGNFVGIHQDGTTKGKMLEITFNVHLKSSSMGGYGLPTNTIASGVYVTKDGKQVEVKAYPLPTVDVPSILIMKEGLKYGDSAIFTVTRTGDLNADGTVKTIESPTLKYRVILSQNGASGSMCYAVIKDLAAGQYTVTEDTSWTWNYTPNATWGTTKALVLNEPVIPAIEGKTEDECIQAYKETVKTAQTATDYGSLTNQAAKKDLYYVLSNSLHLLFRFKNTLNANSALHDEGFVTNVYGDGGGSAEHGGVDDEETDWE